MSDYVPGSATTAGATPPSTSSTAGGSTPPTTTSVAAPAVASQQTTPGAATSVVNTASIMSMLSVSLGVIFHLIFACGAARLSYDKFGSVGWAVLDFFFSWVYYPYYALFLNTPSPALGIVGSARKWKK